MTVEHLVKRTIHVSECPCGSRVECADNPPRERLCACGRWVPFVEVSWTGPDIIATGAPVRR